MKLLVVSPAVEEPREPAVLAQLFAAGLTGYHLRKPGWGRDALAAYLQHVPAVFHPRIVLHSHHDLAAGFAVGGLHERDQVDGAAPPTAQGQCHLLDDIPARAQGWAALLRSRAVHDLDTLRAALAHYDRVLFSPVFPSISKPGHHPCIPAGELRGDLARPRRAEVFALGGIDASRLAACRELGFDGVAVLGAIWQAADPVRVFGELQDALFAHAA